MTKISRAPLVLCWLFEWILWLVFTDNIGRRELIAGAAASALATYFSFAFARRKPIASFGIPHGIKVVWRLPGVLARDTVVVLFALARRLSGEKLPSGIAAIPFKAVADSPTSRSKRALATTLMTITPNTLVLGVLKDREMLFFHRLLPQPVSGLARELSGSGRSA